MTDFDKLERLRQRNRLPAKLVFDTAGRSMAAGTRRRVNTSRQMLYEIEKLCLDLRLDRQPQSAEAIVVGQLADRDDPLKPLAGLPVFLMSGASCLARTISNRQGEFRLQCEMEEPTSLCLTLDGDRLIEVAVEPQVDDGTT